MHIFQFLDLQSSDSSSVTPWEGVQRRTLRHGEVKGLESKVIHWVMFSLKTFLKHSLLFPPDWLFQLRSFWECLDIFLPFQLELFYLVHIILLYLLFPSNSSSRCCSSFLSTSLSFWQACISLLQSLLSGSSWLISEMNDLPIVDY